jgi:amino acid transporter
MAAPDLDDPKLGHPKGGLAWVVQKSLGPGLGTAFLVVVAVAIASCALTVHTGAVRLLFAMARDGMLPGSGRLSKVGATSRTPTVPAVVVGLLAIGGLLANLNDPKVVELIAAVSVVWIDLAYLLVSAPLLYRRLRGAHQPGEAGYFSLGRLGLVVNAIAVVWGVVIVINTGWPRAAVYGDAWHQRFAAPLATIGLILAGTLYYNGRLKPAGKRRRRPGREESR